MTHNLEILRIWYNTGATFTHGESAVGTYNWWINETRSTGGPDVCTSDTSRVTLTINPIPNKPNISITGPNSFCFDGGATNVTLTANPLEPPTVLSYQWYRNGAPIAGGTGISITVDQISESGSYTVRSYGINPTNCPKSTFRSSHNQNW